MRAVRRPGARAIAWAAALGIVAAGPALQAKHQASEQEIEARIQTETNPTKKAKLEMQLGTLKLTEAVAAYDHNRFDDAPKLIGTYWSWMKRAWDVLERSGRDAGRRPQGFKDLDITLRENARQLNDLDHRTPLADRVEIEQVAAKIDALHGEVLGALFPGAAPQDPALSAPKASPPPTSTPPASALRPPGPQP